MKQTNILWLHPHFLNWMGGHTYLYEVMKRLVEKYNMNITLAADAFSKRALMKFKEVGVDTAVLSGRSTNNLLYWIFLPVFIKKNQQKINEINRNDNLVISSMFPMNVVAMRLGKKHIQLCYEPYSLFFDENYISGFPFYIKFFIRLASVFYSRLDVFATKEADKVLTLSLFNKRLINKFYGRSDSRVVYEGVDIDFFKPTQDARLKKKYRDTKILFHTTDFTKIKGTPSLIKCMPFVLKKYPETLLLISHTLKDKKKMKEMRALSKKLGVLKQVKFLGYLDYEKLPAYYSLADVLVQPSIGQSMNMAVKEAMACGTAVITSPEGKEQFKDKEAGYLVDPKNTGKLAERIIELLGDHRLREVMGKNGRQIVMQRFSWESVSRNFYKTIKEVLET